jgi:hypothetical protein
LDVVAVAMASLFRLLVFPTPPPPLADAGVDDDDLLAWTFSAPSPAAKVFRRLPLSLLLLLLLLLLRRMVVPVCKS